MFALISLFPFKVAPRAKEFGEVTKTASLVWRAKRRTERLIQLLRTDTHSPGGQRADAL